MGVWPCDPGCRVRLQSQRRGGCLQAWGGHSLQKGLAPGLGQEKYKMGLKQGSAQRNDGNMAKGHGNQLEWAPNCLRSSLNLKNKGSNRL